MSGERPGALAGVRVADFGRVLAAPYATMLLADMGAEVVKVERPGGGDETRTWGPPWSQGESTYFLAVNRNKSSRVVDLATEGGRREARELAESCDVLVENFRPGTMERYGLGYEQLAAANPGLVYCSVTGFGSGRGADLPGYDLIAQAVGGLMSVTGGEESGPSKAGVALVDVVTGLHAAVGVLAALRHRDRTGRGQRVEVNLLSSLLSALTNQASAYLCTGAVPSRMGNRHPSIAPYEVLRTADRPLAVAAANDRLFGRLAEGVGLPGLAADPRFATNAQRVAHREELVWELESRLRRKPADHWFAKLSGLGVPCGPINDLRQAFELAEQLGLDPVAEIAAEDRPAPVRQVSHPIRMSLTPAAYRSAPPPYPGPPAEGPARVAGFLSPAVSGAGPGVPAAAHPAEATGPHRRGGHGHGEDGTMGGPSEDRDADASRRTEPVDRGPGAHSGREKRMEHRVVPGTASAAEGYSDSDTGQGDPLRGVRARDAVGGEAGGESREERRGADGDREEEQRGDGA